MVAVIATAAVGLAGIAAAFFAPWWVQTRLDDRRDSRELRRALRVVCDELDLCSRMLVTSADAENVGAVAADPIWLATGSWERERDILAASNAITADLWGQLTSVYRDITLIRTGLSSENGGRVPEKSRTKFVRVAGEASQLVHELTPIVD